MKSCAHCHYSEYRSDKTMYCNHPEKQSDNIVLRHDTCANWVREIGADDEAEILAKHKRALQGYRRASDWKTAAWKHIAANPDCDRVAIMEALQYIGTPERKSLTAWLNDMAKQNLLVKTGGHTHFWAVA